MLPSNPDGNGRRELTPRQLEILLMVCEGLTAREIAAKLNLSIKTIEFHKASLSERLNIHTTAGLVRHAVRTGLITP